MLKYISDLDVTSNLVSTAILILTMAGFRFLALHTIEKWNLPSNEVKRKWIVQIRNATLAFLFIGIIFIWAAELKEFAVSIVAIAVALVVATREMILCTLGGVLKYSGDLFTIGDRIEIGGIRGDVINHNFFVTTIYEIGPGKELHQFTGRVVVVPNSMFLTTPVFNETETGHYSLHVFRVPFARTDDWKSAAAKLLDAANIECAPYLSKARNEFLKLARKEGLEFPKIEPRVQIHYPDKDRIDIVIRMPVPARAKGKIEQAILARFSDFHL